MSAPVQKKPINRRLAYMVLLAIGVLGILGVIAVSMNDPRQKGLDDAEAKAAQALADAPVGTAEKARDALSDAARAAKVEQEKEDRQRNEARAAFDDFSRGRPDSFTQPAPGSGAGPGVPQFDPQLLAQLDAAQREVGQRPNVAQATGGALSFPGSGGGNKASAVYENYGIGKKPITGDLFESEDGSKPSADPESTGAFGVYETLKPKGAPSARIVNQGTGINAVLVSRIDTRVAGPIVARVTRDVYDSRSHRVPLIPQGSSLVGDYETSVAAGVDRIPGNFNRLILPDGRAFNLPSFPTSGLDGTIGIAGKHHSNILKAIGPSFVVAVLGQLVDREVGRSEADSSITPGQQGGVFQSPSVMQQTMQPINQAVMQRYEGAKPYFTVEPGQEIRVILTQDLEVPAIKEAK